MIQLQQFNICIMETAAGSKSEGPTQNLQNRVRDAFRKGLQWKWDRDTGSTISGFKESHRHGVSSQEHGLADSSTQRHWPTFAPAAIQKFRRLFSSDNNVSSEHSLDTGSEVNNHGVASCSRNISEEQSNEDNMVRMKTKEKRSEEKATVQESGGENPVFDRIPAVPSASGSGYFDSLHKPVKKLNQDSPSKMEVKQDDVDGSVKSNPLVLQSIVGKLKASDDEDISVNKDHISADQPIVCDVVNDESVVATPQCDKEESDTLDACSNNVTTEEIKATNRALIDMDVNSGTDVKNVDKMHDFSKDNCVKKDLNEETPVPSSSLPSHKSALPTCNDTSNPSIAISTTDDGKAFQQHQKLLEPLYLNIDSTNSAGAHARKSPVTVQEWVDSIPLSSHLDEGPEDINSNRDLSLTAPETQMGNACPSVTLQPASGQSGTLAEQRREAFSRDASPSVQSDTGSHASSVDSYLEARRPDPEEVLLGLGFGGSLHAKEAEVSRIPARFLQPSQVKGVAIDDFLRYQQDLIETFESGYSGYRGLTGGAQIPSVIVAKIMEKLREHERESSTKSSAGSSPGHHADVSKRRFSRAAHRVSILAKIKSRDSITSNAPAHSVLNPDNRKFLDSQGSKSPEVSRKRMIIGHRSFTFDGDGQLIEAETNSEEVDLQEVTPSKPPLPRPLVHKDSVLSSATSLSLTSYDSDSDTDEASGIDRIPNETSVEKSNCEPYPLQNITSDSIRNLSYLNGKGHVAINGEENSLEKREVPLQPISDLALILNRQVVYNENGGMGLKTSTPLRCVSWKDLHQVDLPTSIAPINAPTPASVLWTHAEESSSSFNQFYGKNGNLQEYLKHRNQSTLENNPSELLTILKACSNSEPREIPSQNTKQSSFYKISDFVLPDDCMSSIDSPESQSSLPAEAQQLQRMCSMPKSSSMFLDKELRRKLSLNSSVDSYVARGVAHSPDLKNWSTSSVSSWESEKDFSPRILRGKISNEDENPVFDEKTVEARTCETECNASINPRRGSLKRQKNVDEEDLSVGISSSSNLNANCRNIASEQGDSFEMEELAVEEEIQGKRTGSAHSDSSGFQEEPNHNKTSPKTTLGKQLSLSEPMLHTQLFPGEVSPSYTADHLKRLSLPVIRIQDECGLTKWAASGMCGSDDPFSSSLRRVQSLPSQLSCLGLRRLSECFSRGSLTDSIGNMFSSCSDDSVIHVPRTSLDVTVEGQPGDLPLAAAILDFEGEVEALCTPRECSKCQSTLKNALSKCHSDLLISQENGKSCANLSKVLKALKEAQNKINDEVQQMQNHSCISADCRMNETLERVASVVQQQNSLCLQLEGFSMDLISTIKKLSAQRPSENLSSTPNSPNTPTTSHLTRKEVPSTLQNSYENCMTICQVVEKENRKLQDLVQTNVDELTHVRHLLERLTLDRKI